MRVVCTHTTSTQVHLYVPAPTISELHSWLRSCLVIMSGTEGLAFTGRAARKKTSIKNYPNPSGEAARGVRG